jgi:hypothetical protein
MVRRTSKHRRRRTSLAILALLISAVLIGAYLWHARAPSPPPPGGTQAPSRVQQPSPPAHGGEDFTAAERQSLEDALKRHGAGKQQ